jgi:hypothetical protein
MPKPVAGTSTKSPQLTHPANYNRAIVETRAAEAGQRALGPNRASSSAAGPRPRAKKEKSDRLHAELDPGHEAT